MAIAPSVTLWVPLWVLAARVHSQYRCYILPAIWDGLSPVRSRNHGCLAFSCNKKHPDRVLGGPNRENAGLTAADGGRPYRLSLSTLSFQAWSYPRKRGSPTTYTRLMS